MNVDLKEIADDLHWIIRKADNNYNQRTTHTGEDTYNKVKSGTSISLNKHETVTGTHSQPPLCQQGPSNEIESLKRNILKANMKNFERTMSSNNENTVKQSEAIFRDRTLKDEEQSRIN